MWVGEEEQLRAEYGGKREGEEPQRTCGQSLAPMATLGKF